MKSILIVLLFLLLSAFIGGRKHKSDLDDDNIKGNVKTIIDSEISAKGAFLEKEEYNYNHRGDILSQYLYKSNGDISNKWVQSFDSANMIIRERGYDSRDSLTYIKIYKCDSDWNKIEEKERDTSKFAEQKIVFILDSGKNVIEEDLYDSHGYLDGHWISKYDTAGNRIEQDDFINYSKKLSYKNTYKRNKKGDIIEVSGYEADGSLHARYSCSYSNYDKYGNWQKMVRTHNAEIEYIMKRTIEYYR